MAKYLIYTGESAPTVHPEKYLWKNEGVYKYYTGSTWESLSGLGIKFDSSMLPDDVLLKSELKNEIDSLGITGKDGETLYTWIKYADDEYGRGISDSPIVDGEYKTYIGFAFNKTTEEASDNPLFYQWVLIKGSDGVNGKNGEDGKDGLNGKSIRTTVWETGKQYYSGTKIAKDGNYYTDIVTDKEIGTSENVTYYLCIKDHTSSESITYKNTQYWSKIDDVARPTKIPFILSEKIKANLIDVEDLTGNNAFIENLKVKHLDGASGTLGELHMNTGCIYGHGKLESGWKGKSYIINSDGITFTDTSSKNATDVNPDFKCVLDATDGISVTSNYSGNSGIAQYDASLKTGYLPLTQHLDAKGQYSDITGSHFTSGGTITSIVTPTGMEITTPTAQMYAVASDKTQYYISVDTALPGTTNPTTIYIITEGSNKGLWVGSSKIL